MEGWTHPPGRLPAIDFGNPKLTPVIRALAGNLRAGARAWTPPAGVTLDRTKIGSTECFVLAPVGEEALPEMLYCHGGGFLLPVQTGSLALAALYAQRLRIRVFLPEYRLLPQDPYPAPFQDCLEVWQAMPGRSLLYGESAGGTLAAGLAQCLTDRGEGELAGQVLIYPALDDHFERYPSAAAYPNAAWSASSNRFMWKEYLRKDPGEGTYAVPMRRKNLTGLPPAYVEPQELDILRDEAVAYGQRLGQAGVPVEVNLIPGSYHGFDVETGAPPAPAVLERRLNAMRTMLRADRKDGK